MWTSIHIGSLFAILPPVCISNCTHFSVFNIDYCASMKISSAHMPVPRKDGASQVSKQNTRFIFEHRNSVAHRTIKKVSQSVSRPQRHIPNSSNEKLAQRLKYAYIARAYLLMETERPGLGRRGHPHLFTFSWSVWFMDSNKLPQTSCVVFLKLSLRFQRQCFLFRPQPERAQI